MPDPIIPEARRIHQLLRNSNLFQTKSAAIATFTQINNNADLGTLYDGEILEARYVAGYHVSNGVWTETEPSSAVAANTLRNVEILKSSILKGEYPANTIFLIPHGSGTYDAYTKASSSAGDDVTSNSYTHMTSGSDFYCAKTLFGLVNVYDDTNLKVTFIGESNEGGGGMSVTSTDKTIGVVDNGSSFNLSANIDNKTIKKDGSTGVMSVNIDSTTLLSDSSTGVISVNPVNISLFGEDSIHIDSHQTGGVADGRRIWLKIADDEYVLSHAANAGGLKTNLSLVEYTTTDYDGTTLPSSVQKRYRLRNGYSTDSSATKNIGVPIDIPTDRNLYQVYLGHVDDTLTSSTNPTVVPGTGDDALCFIYQLSDGTYTLAAVNIESYLTETEFSDGLAVASHVVKANLGDGLNFDASSPKKIQANLGTGLQFDSSSPKKIELKKAATSEIGGIRVGAVKDSAVSGLSTAVENAITTDTTPTASNGYRRYAVLSDSNGLGYINVPSLGPNTVAQYSTTAANASPLTGVSNLIVLDSNGQLSTLNVWDCGTYNN